MRTSKIPANLPVTFLFICRKMTFGGERKQTVNKELIVVCLFSSFHSLKEEKKREVNNQSA